jgi:hypothetical protein
MAHCTAASASRTPAPQNWVVHVQSPVLTSLHAAGMPGPSARNAETSVKSAWRNSSTVVDGRTANIKAATPATCGAAKLVPASALGMN